MKFQLRWTLAGIALGGAFLWISLRNIDILSVLETLKATKSLPAIAVLMAAAMFMAVKAIRWSVILRPAGRLSFSRLHSAVYIGTAANLVIAHSGEILRAALVGRRERLAPSAVLASVGVERVFDFITVATLLGVVLLVDRRLHESAAAAGIIAIGLVLIGLALMLILMKPSWLRNNLAAATKYVLPAAAMEFLSSQLKKGLVGLSVLGSPWLLTQIFLLSLLQWGFMVAAVWLSAASVGHEIDVPTAITIWVLMVIGLTLPSSPVQLGTIQLAFMLGLAHSEAGAQAAFAASVIYTIGVNLPYMIIGLACWFAAGQLHLRNPESISR